MNQILDNQAGYIKAMWCGSQECEEKVKDQTKATIRNIPFNQEKVGKSCVCCGQLAEQMVYFARAY